MTDVYLITGVLVIWDVRLATVIQLVLSIINHIVTHIQVSAHVKNTWKGTNATSKYGELGSRTIQKRKISVFHWGA